MSEDAEFKNRHAVVTGGGRGIGASITSTLDTLGVTVTIMGRDEAVLVAQAEKLNNTNYCVVDISEADAVAEAFEAIKPVDILVNNAGAASSSPFVKLTFEEWHASFDVNLHGAFYCTQAVIPHMSSANYGRIINIASTSALKGYAYVAAYCAAKHALLGMTRAIAVEFAKTNITINAVCPGFTETDLLSQSVTNIMAKTGRNEEEARAALFANNPQKRFIQPKEIADTVAWLIQDSSRSITGQAISVNGGEVM